MSPFLVFTAMFLICTFPHALGSAPSSDLWYHILWFLLQSHFHAEMPARHILEAGCLKANTHYLMLLTHDTCALWSKPVLPSLGVFPSKGCHPEFDPQNY